MEGLIELLAIFALFAFVGWRRRAVEKSKESESRKNPLRQYRAEDLPEATRRMIYGNQDVPTARPAGSTPREALFGERPQKRPTSSEPDMVDLLQEVVTQARSTEAPSVLRPAEAPVARPAPVVRSTPQQARPRVVTRPEPVREATPVYPASPRRRMAQTPSRAPAPSPLLEPAHRPRRRHERRKGVPLSGVVRDLDDVRRGIILSEILGTPKGLQGLE